MPKKYGFHQSIGEAVLLFDELIEARGAAGFPVL